MAYYRLSMSTDLYGVRILAREGATVTFRVFNVYGDWQRLPNPVPGGFWVHIASDALMDPWREGALREEIGDRRFEEDWLRAHAWDYVRSVTLLEMANYCTPLRYTFYYERGGQWVDEQRLPQAVFRVTYSEARWVEHMLVGEAWGTTAYEPGPPARSAQEGSLAEVDGAEVDGAGLARVAELVEHADVEIAARALHRLGQAGPAASPWSRQVGRRLDDRAPAVREAALRALACIGDETSVAALAGELCDGLQAVPALLALARVGPAARAAADPLLQLTRARTVSLRSLAEIAYFSVTGHAATWSSTQEALRGSRRRRERAFTALTSLPEPALGRALPLLTRLLEDEQALPWWTDLLLLLERRRPLPPEAAAALSSFAAAQSDRPGYATLARRAFAC
jgi:hypothetical protein